MKRDHWYNLIFLFISLLIIVGSLYPNIVEWYRTPPNTTYSFSFGHNGDFNQVLYFIKSGTEGHLLYKIPYTDQDVPPFLLQTLYFVAGFILSPITKSPVVILYILRIISLSIFLASLVKLIRTAFRAFPLQLTAYMLAITSTSVWATSMDTGQTTYTIPIPWNDTFHVFRKFTILPHHFLAIAAIMLLTLTLARTPWTKRSVFVASVLTLTIAFLHPYHLFLVVLITILYGCLLWIYKRPLRKSVILMTASVVVTAGVTYGYYAIMMHRVYPWTQQNFLRALLQFHQAIPFSTYILALGPIAFLSLLFLLPVIARRVDRLLFLLFLWAILPFLVFQFADIGIIQPFKTHQYIPLALLAAAGIQYLIDRSRVFLVLIPIIIGSTVLYMMPPYLAVYHQLHEEHVEQHFNIYIPDYLTHTFIYFNKHTPGRSVVLAGAAVSIMIPAFTHNAVFIGQGDSVPNYDKRVMSVVDFFNQNMDPDAMKTLLKAHHISYVLFDIDAPAYTDGFMKYPFLKELYHDGFSSIVQVVL